MGARCSRYERRSRHRYFPLLPAKEADVLQREVDLLECLLAEIGDAEQILAGRVQEIVDREDALFFEAIGRADGQADFRSAHLEPLLQVLGLTGDMVQRNTRHGLVPPWSNMKRSVSAARSASTEA